MLGGRDALGMVARPEAMAWGFVNGSSAAASERFHLCDFAIVLGAVVGGYCQSVKSWVAAVVAVWRVEPVRISCPVPVQTAVARIASGIAEGNGARVSRWTGWPLDGSSPRVVRGDWDGEFIQVHVHRLGSRSNSWGPRLVARLVDGGDGSTQVRGEMGISEIVRIFTAVWLAGIAVAAVFIWTLALTGMVHVPIVAMILPVVMFGFGLGLAVGAKGDGRKDEEFLLNWIRDRLRSTDE
jgi:hypothetical protein